MFELKVLYVLLFFTILVFGSVILFSENFRGIYVIYFILTVYVEVFAIVNLQKVQKLERCVYEEAYTVYLNGIETNPEYLNVRDFRNVKIEEDKKIILITVN